MNRALPLAACLTVLSGCGSGVIVKHEPVEVTRYVRAPVSAELTRDRVVAEPDPAGWRCDAGATCRRVYTNEQVEAMRRDYRRALQESNADKAAIRAEQDAGDGDKHGG